METIHIDRTDGGRLAEHWGVRDELGAMRRMGAIPELSLSWPSRRRNDGAAHKSEPRRCSVGVCVR